LIHVWARLAKIVPDLINFVNRAPVTSALVKRLIGIAPQRQMPAFARETFKSWFSRRASRHNSTRRVILWPDTFNNFFHPETAKAAVEVLENAGFEVVVPKVDLCCGRPLYDYGMMGTAKRWLGQILRELKEEIEAGTPLVGLEPSCLAVFRDELVELFPQNEDARRLCKQSFTLAEFLHEHAKDYELPRLSRRALVHGHCHDKAVLNFDCEKELLKKMGVELECPDTGCCGMAGGFGFEKEHVDVSLACGERVLLPEVRRAAKETLIVSDGFSCREQIRQTTDRQALHFAQVLKMATANGSQPLAQSYPEKRYVAPDFEIGPVQKLLLWSGAAVIGAALIGAIWKKGDRNRR
jgi:Fe-S oxidoreductase